MHRARARGRIILLPGFSGYDDRSITAIIEPTDSKRVTLCRDKLSYQ